MTEEIFSRKGEIFLVHYYPVMNEEGRISGIIRYAKDITEAKKVEQRIQQTEKLVSLGQLSAGIAHEINNPLGVILCYSDLLKQQLAGQQQGLEDVATIEKHARNCQRIVSDLLNFSRGQETVRKTASLNEAVGQVVHLLGRQFERKRRKIELDLDPELPDISIDVDQIKQVVLNLIINAHQAMGNKGVIRVVTRYSSGDGEVTLEVWDNGEGIPAEIKDRIFDPFFSTKRDGSGLGLSVSYGIIRNHGGDVQVESRPGEWTLFTIVLPVDGRG
jgi:signal transduction histidine kinase